MPDVLKSRISIDARRALTEDIGPGDLTARLVTDFRPARAIIIAREAAVLCGIPWAQEVFAQVDPAIRLDWQFGEGDAVGGGDIVCRLYGPACGMLTAERTALNFLQALSGTATVTRSWTEMIADLPCRILDTRKTIPGLRLAQKYAVRTGGGVNHRIGLFDGILIKENHIRCAGSIAKALEAARQLGNEAILTEIEVESIEELEQALAAGANRIMLDNFEIHDLAHAVRINVSRAELEASGNVSRENLRQIALSGVDYVSIGALTKNVQAIDLSMQFSFR